MEQTKSMYKLGIISLLLSAILTSISQVFYANQVQAVHPFIFTGVSFLLTTIYFQLFTMKSKTEANWENSWLPLVKLNIMTAITFLGYYCKAPFYSRKNVQVIFKFIQIHD